MRTTIRIDDDLYRRAKATAAKSGRTVGAFIEDAVREALRPRPSSATPVPELTVFEGDGLLPGIVLDDNAALRERMDEGEPLGALR